MNAPLSDEYSDLETFAEGNGIFDLNQMRWILRNRKRNGLNDSGAVVQVGRRILIHAETFKQWLSTQKA